MFWPLLLAFLVETHGDRVLRGQGAMNRTAIPLELKGATCADPPRDLPKYCCNGIVPSPDFMNTCECNPGWTHQECVCKAYLLDLPCHACMVHLPATNRWLKSFSKSELYENCNTCVSKCKAEMEADAQC